MTPITSHHNEKLKEAQRLQRRRERDASGRFVAEGEDLLAAADAAGWAPLATFCAAGTVTGPLTLVIGAEREGLPEEVLAACDRVAHIPILGESLNAGMAATVALYETTRGRIDA